MGDIVAELDKNTENFSSFETTLARLQEIVSSLEQGNVPLDTGMRLYKEGMNCARQCRQIIQQAKHEISVWQEGEESPFTRTVECVLEDGAES